MVEEIIRINILVLFVILSSLINMTTSQTREDQNIELTELYRTMLDRDILRHDPDYYGFEFMRSKAFTRMWEVYKKVNGKTDRTPPSDREAKIQFLKNLKKMLSRHYHGTGLDKLRESASNKKWSISDDTDQYKPDI